ncbi:putative aminotransferase class I and II, partial [Colletotrichum sublineola]
MLSSARIATRQAAVRRMAALPVSAARAGSTWANVPQGPPDVSRDSGDEATRKQKDMIKNTILDKT